MDVVVGSGLAILPHQQVLVVDGVVADASVGFVAVGGGGQGNGRFQPPTVIEQMPPPHLLDATAVLLPHHQTTINPDQVHHLGVKLVGRFRLIEWSLFTHMPHFYWCIVRKISNEKLTA